VCCLADTNLHAHTHSTRAVSLQHLYQSKNYTQLDMKAAACPESLNGSAGEQISQAAMHSLGAAALTVLLSTYNICMHTHIRCKPVDWAIRLCIICSPSQQRPGSSNAIADRPQKAQTLACAHQIAHVAIARHADSIAVCTVAHVHPHDIQGRPAKQGGRSQIVCTMHIRGPFTDVGPFFIRSERVVLHVQ